MTIAIITNSEQGIHKALEIIKELPDAKIYSTRSHQEVEQINNISAFTKAHFRDFEGFLFIGALGICVRSISPVIDTKHTDPAVINMDVNGQYVQSVLSGHKGGGNAFAEKIAGIVGAFPVITTVSDAENLWPLDTFHRYWHWTLEEEKDMDQKMALFVNKHRVALLLQIKDAGTAYMERTAPSFCDIFYDVNDIDFSSYDLLIAVTPFLLNVPVPVIMYRPNVLAIGLGSQKQIDPGAFIDSLIRELTEAGLSYHSISHIASIEFKQEEKAFQDLALHLNADFLTYPQEKLQNATIDHPSDYVNDITGTPAVAEASARIASGNGSMLVPKTKVQLPHGPYYTFAVGLEKTKERKGHIAIVGAGPGDHELISVKGKHYLQMADLILYAGSLVPEELTLYAKPGATVRSSADMNLESQMKLIEEFYNRQQFIVRLHTGDPSIYGAIQEQMALFDQQDMNYEIIPGISSFQAAAAKLKSEFTIPETVQTIIITRGEGRTPVPEKEKLNKLAQSQSTMCIYLSVRMAENIQNQLLEHYPPETPVAVCYKLTWAEEKIWQGTLQNLVNIVRENRLTRTVLMIVGEAIGYRGKRSVLYHH